MSLKLGNLRITSPAFPTHGAIPRRYTGDGENISPPLEWSGAPAGTEQFGLVCFDADAARPFGVTHWVIYGIPLGTATLEEGVRPDAFTPGANARGAAGYAGPRPPSGHGPHHYYFWLYALDGATRLGPGLSRLQFLEAAESHILEQARLIGLYER